MKKNYSQEKITNRLATIWGFNEGALGGLLHLMKFPFRGMIIGANSVFLIHLLAFFLKNKKLILKNTLLVILVKAIISPYTPLTAYIAVTFQGITGFLFYNYLKQRKLSLILHSLLTQVQSSFQKFIGLTIFFGMTFWDSLNVYVHYILKKFELVYLVPDGVNYSTVIILTYVLIHMLAGIYVAFVANGAPGKISQKLEENIILPVRAGLTQDNNNKSGKKKSRFWWQRKSGVLLILVFFLMILLSIFDPALEESNIYNIVYMLVRSVIITLVWFLFLAPLVLKLFRKYISNKESVYQDELREMIDLIPHMKAFAKERWGKRSGSGIRKNINFMQDLFYDLLFLSADEKEESSEENKRDPENGLS